MNNKDTHFPAYRKLSNGKVFYKIISDRIFEEKQLLGDKILCFKIEAQKYPEIIRIQDMLHENDTYPEISKEEWEQLIPTNHEKVI